MLSPNSVTWDLAAQSTRNVASTRTTFEYNTVYTIEVLEDFDDVGLNYVHTIKSDTTLQLTEMDEALNINGEWQTRAENMYFPQQREESSRPYKPLIYRNMGQMFGWKLTTKLT